MKTAEEWLKYNDDCFDLDNVSNEAILLLIRAIQADAASAPSVPEIESAQALCKVYFDIAAEAIGEDSVRAKRDAMLSAAPQPPDGWQPIETAPKDGRAFLADIGAPMAVYAVHNRATGDWNVGYPQTQCFQGEWNDDYIQAENFKTKEIKAWMPLPQPPKKED